MKNRVYILILILALLLFHGLNNYLVLTKSRYIPKGDSVGYFQQLNEICQSLKETKLNLKLPYKIYSDLIFPNYNHPRLFLYTAAPFFLFRIDKNIVVMANLIYFAILLFATYGIGKRLYSFEVGILSSFLVSMFPAVFGLSRVFLLDFSLTAMVTLTFYLFTVNRFDRLIFSFLVGLIIGLGLFTKASYSLFLIPILVYFVIQQKNKKDNKSIIGLSFSILIALLIAGRFYFPLAQKIDFFHMWMTYGKRGNPYFYLQSLLNRQLLPIFFSLFIISLIFCFRNKKYYLPMMTIMLLAFFSVCPSKTDRFIMPVFPYIAVMIGGFIWSLPRFRKTSIVVLILFSFLQYFAVSYKPYVSTKYTRYLIPGISLPKVSRSSCDFIDYADLTSIIDEGDWQSPAEEIIKIMSADKKTIGMDKKINLGVFSLEVIHFAIIYWSIVNGLPLQTYTPMIDSAVAYGFLEDAPFSDPVAHFDFVIIQDSVHGDADINRRYRLNDFKQNFIDSYVFIRTIILPDNSSCAIYKRNLKNDKSNS